MLALKLLQVSLQVMMHRNLCQIFCIYSTQMFLFVTSNTFFKSGLYASQNLDPQTCIEDWQEREFKSSPHGGDTLSIKILQLINPQNSHRIYSYPKFTVNKRLLSNIKIIRIMK